MSSYASKVLKSIMLQCNWWIYVLNAKDGRIKITVCVIIYSVYYGIIRVVEPCGPLGVVVICKTNTV